MASKESTSAGEFIRLNLLSFLRLNWIGICSEIYLSYDFAYFLIGDRINLLFQIILIIPFFFYY